LPGLERAIRRLQKLFVRKDGSAGLKAGADASG
jgi:hypothetical protein